MLRSARNTWGVLSGSRVPYREMFDKVQKEFLEMKEDHLVCFSEHRMKEEIRMKSMTTTAIDKVKVFLFVYNDIMFAFQ